ncbi:hypothetical protein BBF96_13015 [Anoxybacter fermentans]|uniref:Peptidase M30, hyicolysin n=1 Tax=Anoxybacter fermentans TaxID=1323375 RepID=A0A3Q9HS96_9FIRM|nr:carboxypeptidase-like regulatory domain-containing protein [Anoxybacter fermentans]AZR74237.1 hypothetical protein BBF96_13015 [Anoxybacter fermentans]
MKLKKLLFMSVFLIIVLSLTGCFNVKTLNKTTVTYSDLNVKVINSNGSTIEADLIVLIDSDKNIVDFTTNSSIYQFPNLKSGKYTLVVGKEGYKAFIDDNLLISKDITKEVKLIEEEDLTQVKIEVYDENGQPIDNAQITVFKDGNIVNKGLTINGEVFLPRIWRGILYEYKIEKRGYKSYSGYYFNRFDAGYITIYLNSSTSETSIPEFEEYIFDAEDEKSISLGYLGSNDYIVVGITPLNFNSNTNNHFEGTITANINNKNIETNLIQLPIKREMAKLQQLKNNFYNLKENIYFNQKELDAKLRQKEKELIEQYGFEEILKNITKSRFNIQSYSLGSERTFYIRDFNREEYYYSITATLKRISNHSYIYVDNNITINQTDLDYIAEQFDNQIYPTNMKFFASHEYTSYDYDENGKIIILLTPIIFDGPGIVMGYFFLGDYLPKTYIEDSNEADMIYLNSNVLELDNDKKSLLNELLSTVAHEFQHLIFFCEKLFAYRVIEDTWINEGFSGLAQYLNGYYNYVGDGRIYNSDGTETNPDALGYFNKPADESLLSWENKLSDYGASNLFAFYLYHLFGEQIIKDINTSPSDPVNVISEKYRTFSTLFLDWIATNYVGEYDINPILNYPMDLKVQPETKILNALNISEDFSIKATGVLYYLICGTGADITLNINLNANTGVFIYRSIYQEEI